MAKQIKVNRISLDQLEQLTALGYEVSLVNSGGKPNPVAVPSYVYAKEIKIHKANQRRAKVNDLVKQAREKIKGIKNVK